MMKNRAFKNWSQDEINFLRKNYLQMTMKNIAKKLNRSYYGIKAQIKRSKLFDEFVANQQDPFKDLSIADRAYIAGFIDGEGFVGIAIGYKNQKPNRAVPSIKIENSNRKVIEWIAEKANFGRWRSFSIHTYSKISNEQLRFTHQIKIENRFRIKPFLKAILPYLQVKRENALELLKFLEMKTHRRALSIQDWKQVVKIKSLIDSVSPLHIRSLKSLKKFVKELEDIQIDQSNS